MEKRSASNVGHRAPHLLPGMDDVDAKGVDGIAPNVIAVDPRDEDFTFVVIDEETTNHTRTPPENFRTDCHHQLRRVRSYIFEC